MKKIGLTGGIGSGKSSVGKWFKNKGISVTDIDQIVHEVMEKNEIIVQIGREFGEEYVEDGQINRRLLGGLIFGNDIKRKRLEAIIHPIVFEEMIKIAEELEKKEEKIAIFEIPLLFEVGWEEYFDEVWVVYVPVEIQKKRIMERNNLSEEEAEKRISSQMPLINKKEKADVVLDNSQEWEETEKQLNNIWNNM